MEYDHFNLCNREATAEEWLRIYSHANDNNFRIEAFNGFMRSADSLEDLLKIYPYVYNKKNNLLGKEVVDRAFEIASFDDWQRNFRDYSFKLRNDRTNPDASAKTIKAWKVLRKITYRGMAQAAETDEQWRTFLSEKW